MKVEQSLSMQLPASYTGLVPTQNRQQESFAQILEQVSAGPASMDDLFVQASQATGVPVNLLKAVAKAESDFDPKVVSRCGAMGVMQLMPENVKTLGISDPFDPAQNIMGGAKHLRDMLDRYDGNTVLALAAYNAGPGNVNKYGGIPPFKETQNYVKKVMQYAGEELSTPAISLNQSFGTSQMASLSNLAMQGVPLSELMQAVTSADTQQDIGQLCDMMHIMIQARLNDELTRANSDDTEIPSLTL